MGISIFDLKESKVASGLEGKTFLFYGTNGTGKTKQSSRFPKPCYLAFEMGANCINGIKVAPIKKFSDFISVVKQLTNSSTIDKAKEMYQTIILDTVEAAGDLCADYVCEKFGAETIGSGNNGYGLWKEYSAEWNKWLRLLTNNGYTVVFIAHEGTREFKDENGEEYTKVYPKGDKRIVDPVCDLVDIVGYAAVNGIDDNGNEIKSSLYMKQTRKFHARSRLDCMPICIKEFTVEALTEAVEKAIKEQAKIDGRTPVTYNEQQEVFKTTELSYEELRNRIGAIAKQMKEKDKMEDYFKIVEEYLGKGKKVKDADKSQTQLLTCILNELETIS